MKIVHNGQVFEVDYQSASEVCKAIEDAEESELQYDTVYTQEAFKIFINYLNTHKLDINKEYIYQLESIATIFDCEELHQALLDYAFSINDFRLVKNIADQSFQIGYQYYNQGKAANQELETLRKQIQMYKTIIDNTSPENTGKLIRCKRDPDAELVRVGFLGASNTGKT